MSLKDDFVELFKQRCGGKHPNDFKKNPAALAQFLNADNELKELFRMAVIECTPTDEEAAAAGLGNLFPDGM